MEWDGGLSRSITCLGTPGMTPPHLSSQNNPAAPPRPGWCITGDATGGSTACMHMDMPLTCPTAPWHRTGAGQGKPSKVTTHAASVLGTGNPPAGEASHDLGQRNVKKEMTPRGE